jgi:hypothetical protein
MDHMTFTSPLGAWLGPVLIWLRQRQFFEVYAYIPLMTIAAGLLYYRFTRRTTGDVPYAGGPTRRLPWEAFYFSLCWIATNSFAVGLKTLIVEELDYGRRVWFEHLIGPGHLVLTLVCLAHLWLIVRPGKFPLPCCLALQASIALGYALGGLRILSNNGPDVLSGVFLLAYFGVWNYDLLHRLRIAQNHRPRRSGSQVFGSYSSLRRSPLLGFGQSSSIRSACDSSR